MKHLCSLIFILCNAVLFANNMEYNVSMYLAPASECNKKVNETLKNEKTQRLFTGKIIGVAGTTSGCSFVNHFAFQKAGFSFKITPAASKVEKKTTRISANIDWTLLEGGPFKASDKESFYEGTVLSCTRSLLPGTFSPLGINLSKDAKVIYIPAIQFSKLPKTAHTTFQRGDKWEISVKVIEPGKAPQTIQAVPTYHRGRFPVTNPAGIKCRMYNYQGVTVMNMYYSHQRGVREDGTPVMEEITLNLCFYAPPKGSVIQLADLTSFCFAENAAFTKFPAAGGKQIRYQVFLTVK